MNADTFLSHLDEHNLLPVWFTQTEIDLINLDEELSEEIIELPGFYILLDQHGNLHPSGVPSKSSPVQLCSRIYSDFEKLSTYLNLIAKPLRATNPELDGVLLAQKVYVFSLAEKFKKFYNNDEEIKSGLESLIQMFNLVFIGTMATNS